MPKLHYQQFWNLCGGSVTHLLDVFVCLFFFQNSVKIRCFRIYYPPVNEKSICNHNYWYFLLTFYKFSFISNFFLSVCSSVLQSFGPFFTYHVLPRSMKYSHLRKIPRFTSNTVVLSINYFGCFTVEYLYE